MDPKRTFDLRRADDVEFLSQFMLQVDNEPIDNEILDESDFSEDDVVESEILHPDTESDSDSEFSVNTCAGYAFTGKDNTKWEKFVPNKAKKRMPQNIITKLPGVIGSARGVKTVLDSWRCFFFR